MSFFEIGFPRDFSMSAVLEFTEQLRSRHLFGGMSRAQFERAIFTQPPEEWPLGHLQDHRVCLPRSLAEDCLAGSSVKLADLLSRFLCTSTRNGAREMIAAALDLKPEQDAKFLLEIGKGQPQAFFALLCGRLHEVEALSPGRIDLRRQAQAARRLMLLYYGALEVQLIAARARAFDQFDFGIIVGDGSPTVGGFMKGCKRNTKGIIYAGKTFADEVEFGRRPSGRTPAAISEAAKLVV